MIAKRLAERIDLAFQPAMTPRRYHDPGWEVGASDQLVARRMAKLELGPDLLHGDQVAAVFEFRDGQGKWHEVDLLVLGRRRLHLVELKYYTGTLRGDDLTCRRDGH